MRNGVIERVVENWLTSANERQYQIPFCQVLSFEGEVVIYISPHGVLEQGKDVITIGRDKVPRAYQLKGGKIQLKAWQDFKGELDELVEIPISHPSIRSKRPHKPYLVTNGSVADSVLQRIESNNKVWRKYNPNPLQLIHGSELVTRFVKAHGSFLPRETKDFSRLLELIVNAGPGPFDKERFSSFLESVLPIRDAQRVSPRDVGRSISSAILLTSYIVQGCEREKNYWAVFEAWVVVGSYILGTAAKHRTPVQWWGESFTLCELAAVRALEGLCEECVANKMMITQDDPFTDGTFYGARVAILAGILSALSLYHRVKLEKWNHEAFVHDFLTSYLRRIQVWGESAAPYLIMAALELEQHGAHLQSEQLVTHLVRTIVDLNGSKGRGLPNPYYEPEDALRLLLSLDTTNSEVFSGHSYSLEALVEFLTRRLLRQALTHLWEKITKVHFTWFRPAEDWEWFRWKAEHGSLDTRMPNTPQSWAALLDTAESESIAVPSLLRERPPFAFFFGLVFPHRFGVPLLRLLEHATRQSGQSQ
jgi:hypothetical protein